MNLQQPKRDTDISQFHEVSCIKFVFFHIHCLTQIRTAVVVKPCNQHELSPKMSWKKSSYLVAGWTKRLAWQHLEGEPMLDGARGNKQVWHPHIRTQCLHRNKCVVLKKVLTTLLGLFGAPSVLSTRALWPFCLPLVTPLQHFLRYISSSLLVTLSV